MPGYRSSPPDTDRLPGGIPYIILNEAAERFSFYGMKAILVVFMTKHLVDSAGDTAVMSDAQARTWAHLFIFAAYFFPIIGAYVSDVLWGKYRTIIALSIVYCLGHLALALDETRLGLSVGLTLIAIGSGGIKPCVSAHVGDQFGRRNQHLLPRVFAWFYFSINLGAFISTLLTPRLLDSYGPNIAFGVPGLLMLLATWVFWLGREKFVHIAPAGPQAYRALADPQMLWIVLRIAAVFLFVIPFWALFDQTTSAWVLQARSMDRNWLGIEWLEAQVGAVNPVLILVLIPIFSYAIYPAMARWFEPTPLRKISIGLFLTVPSFVVAARIESQITGGQVVTWSSEEKQGPRGVERLIDGVSDGTGWASGERKPAETPQGKAAAQSSPPPVAQDAGQSSAVSAANARWKPEFVIIRLREYRSWPIEAVRIDLSTAPRDDALGRPANWAREVLIQVADAPEPESWRSVGRFPLEQTAGFQTLQFEPVTAAYVRLEFPDSFGGDRIEVGEVEVLAVGELPPDAASEAAEVWPNVAATGYRPWIVWQILAYLILTAAEVMVSITCLEFAYSQAPNSLKSTIMSIFLLTIAMGNLFIAGVNAFIQRADGTVALTGADYYWFFSAVMLVTAVLFVAVASRYRSRTYIQE